MGQQPTKASPGNGQGSTGHGQAQEEAVEIVDSFDLSNKDLSVTGAAEMKQLGEKYSEHLKTLTLQNCQLTYLENIIYFINLEYLDLSRNWIQNLEDEKNEVVFFLKMLTNLNLSYNYMTSIPELIFNLAKLTVLNISNNNIALVCDEIGLLESLTDLDVSFNQLAFLPDTLGKLTQLSKLKINSNELKELPGLAPSVIFLNLNDNLLKALPPSIGLLTNLKKLYVDNNELLEVPTEIGKLVSLRELNLNFNQLIDLPQTLGSLTELTILDISDNLFEAKEWYDPEISSLLKFIKTKTIKPARNGKFKSKKRRQDTLRVHPTQRKAGTSARPKLNVWDAQDQSSSSPSSSGPVSSPHTTPVDKDSQRKSGKKPMASVLRKLFRFKNIDDVHIGETRSIVMVDRVVCDYHSLEISDVYLLDTADSFYVWVGPTSHGNELQKAKHIVDKLNDEFGSNLPVVVLDSKSMMVWDVAGEFWMALGVLNEGDVKSFMKLLRDPKALAKARTIDHSVKNPNIQQSEAFLFALAPPAVDKEALSFRIDQAKIYKFVEDEEERVQIQIIGAGEPPVKSVLDSSSTFVIDILNNPSVYIWAGTFSSSESKSWALLKAEEIINRDVIDSGYERALAWNMDGAETWDFKELFFDWLDVEWDPLERARIQSAAKMYEAMMKQIEEESLSVLHTVKLSTPKSPRSKEITTSPKASPTDRSKQIDEERMALERRLDEEKTAKLAEAEAEKLRLADEAARQAEMEMLEQKLAEKRRKQAAEAAAAAANEARIQADKRREAARREAELAEANRKAERERAQREAEAAAKKAREEAERKEAEEAAAAKKAKDAAKKAKDAAEAASLAKAKEQADKEKAEREKKAAEAERAAILAMMVPPPSSRATPSNLLKTVQAGLEAEKKQMEKIAKLWRPPALDKTKIAAYSGPDTLGDLPESRGALLAGPRRAIGPQGRRAATANSAAAAKAIETKETVSGPRLAVGGAFGLLRAVGGEAALLQRKEKPESSSSSSNARTDADAQVAQKGNPRLIWIKGRRKILLRQVPVAASSLNSGDVFIFDNGKGVLYQWNGKESNRIAKGKGMDLAKNIKDKEYSGTAKVVVLDEGKTDTNVTDAFWKQLYGHLPNQDPPADALPLPTQYSDIPIKSAGEGGTDDDAEALLKTSCDLYKLVPGKKDRLEPELVASYPLKKDILVAEECYIMDCVCEIYVWCGKSSPLKSRKQSLDVAIKLMTSRTEQFWVAPIVRELPGGESVMFREKFSDWGYGPPIQMQKIAVGKNVAKKAEAEKIDVQSLFDKITERQEVMVDTTGNGEVHVWRIVDFKKVPVDPETYGQFCAGDTYIILYKYKVGNREAFLVYYWQGRTATINEKGTSALLTIELDKEFKANGTAKEVRVVQNQEPKHFLLVFKDRYVVHSGKHVDHFLTQSRQAKADGKGSLKPEKSSLYEIGGHHPSYTRLIQVEPSKALLKSNTTFLLFTASRKNTYVWQGAFASDFSKTVSDSFVKQLAGPYGSPETPTVVKEGSEPSDFWKALQDSDKSYPKWKSELGQARLFHASEASGQFRVHEVPAPFSRDELTRNDCYILDAWDRVYVWQQKANASETKQTLETAVAYYEVAAKERSLKKSSLSSLGPVLMVTHGKEPLVFTSRFMAWSPIPDSSNLDSNLASGTDYLAQFSTKYTYDDLVEKRYPAGIDTTRLEDYMDDDEFEKALGMDRAAFAALPGWQAQKLKRAKGLF